MSTAHKPQLRPTIVGSSQAGQVVQQNRIFASRDLPGHLTLKERREGQGTQSEFKYKDFKKELLEKEKKLKLKGKQQTEEQMEKIKELEYSDDDEVVDKVTKKIKKNTEEEEDNQENKEKTGEPVKKVIQQHQNLFPQDADDADFMNSSSSDDEKDNKKQNKSSSESDSDDSDDSEDEDDLLMQEFEKIKQQKEEEEKKKNAEKFNNMEENQQKQLLSGNPLLADGSYSLKKTWYEDTVFKNQARIEKKDKKRFINDNVRSDFHKKFLKKYVNT